MVPLRYRVTGRRQDLADTVTLTLDAVRERLEPPRPGQFQMLWAFGVGEVPISLAGHDRDGRLQHTIRAVGAVTEALCATEPGTMIGVRGPFGRGFDLDAAAGADLLVIAGGIGLAPLRPVIQAILNDRERFGEVAVLIGARSPDLLVYRDELDDWRRGGLDVAVTVDTAGPGWTGEVGVVTKLITRKLRDPSRTVAFTCGPEAMMRFTVYELFDRGVDPKAVQVSLERNMHCAIGLCGRCQLGSHFVCRNGPVFPWTEVADVMKVRER
jgi:NAD(P)H-flavin reductase